MSRFDARDLVPDDDVTRRFAPSRCGGVRPATLVPLLLVTAGGESLRCLFRSVGEEVVWDAGSVDGWRPGPASRMTTCG
jgi:hypothetical protein